MIIYIYKRNEFHYIRCHIDFSSDEYEWSSYRNGVIVACLASNECSFILPPPPSCYKCAAIHLFLNHLMYYCAICTTFIYPHIKYIIRAHHILESNIYLSKVNILVSPIHYSSTCEHAHTLAHVHSSYPQNHAI